jgi:hypothetical protein
MWWIFTFQTRPIILVLIQNLFSGGGLLCILWTIQALEFILGELHISMYPSQIKNLELYYVILLQLSIFCYKLNASHSLVLSKIYLFNTVKHNCLTKILITGSLILYSFRQHVSVVKRPSSGLQRTKNATCETFSMQWDPNAY